MKKSIALICSVAILISVAVPLNAEKVQQGATHSDGFLVKENFEFYNTPSDGYWVSNDSNISLSIDNTGNSYKGSGNSLKCEYDFTGNSNSVSFYKNDFIYNEDLNGEILGEGSKLSFWMKNDNAIKLTVRLIDGGDYSKYTLTSKQLSVPSGETVVAFDWSDFIPNSYSVHHDYSTVYQLQFIFAAPNKAGSVYLDEIGFYKGEKFERLHGEGFKAASVDASKWINKNGNSELLFLQDSPRYHGKDNTSALEIKYSSLSLSDYPNFYYNDGLRTDLSADTIFGSDTVLSFWVHSSQSVKLGVTYMDSSLTSGSLVQCNSRKINIPKGESIVKIPMADLAPQGHEMQYKWAYQLQLSVLPSEDGASSGRLYIDEIGFYSTNTDTLLSQKLDEIKEATVDSAEDISEIFDYFDRLTDEEIKDITPYTLSRYNSLKLKYNEFAPYISEVISGESGSEFGKGTLTFITALDDAENAGCKVKEIGSVIYREALLDKDTALTLDTPDTLRVGEQITAVKDKYEIMVVLKSRDFDGDYTGDGYFGTSYIARPYVIYEKQDGSILTVYGSEAISSRSREVASLRDNAANAFDNDSSTVWIAPKAGENTFIHNVGEKSFNSIRFRESASAESKIYECRLEIKNQNGEWQEIYCQDEMGDRVALLDKTYKANKVRVTVNSSGISRIEDILFEIAQNYDTIKYISYYPSGGYTADKVKKDYEQLSYLDGAILFDFGCWNTKGEFNFTAGNAENVGTVANAIKAGKPDTEIWFCLQNYDRNEISNIVSSEGITEAAAKNRLLADSTVRRKLIDFSVGLCDNYGLTGIDIDFEYPSTSIQWRNYGIFLYELGTALHNKGYKLSAALSAWGINNYFGSDTVNIIDSVNIMSYDSEGSDALGRHNTYASALKHIDYFKALGFKPEQLNLGLGFYGKSIDNPSLTAGYNSLCKRFFDGITGNRNMYGKYYCPGTALTADKTYRAMSEGLGGVFSWTFKQDYKLDGGCSLNKAVTNTIAKYGS